VQTVKKVAKLRKVLILPDVLASYFGAGLFPDNLRIYFVVFVSGVLLLHSSCNKGTVETINIHIRTVDDIVPIESSIVKPYHYEDVISLRELPVIEKKQKFIDLILPAILIAKVNLREINDKIKEIIAKDTAHISNKEKRYVQEWQEKYKAKNVDDLILKLNTHPTSIVIAQAALECGWGTSRFFLEVNNIFGIWTYNSNSPSTKSKGTRNGKPVYLKKYASFSESIDSYFLTIALGPYENFRYHRARTKNPYQLIDHLTMYSENGAMYIDQLKAIINKNNLTKYDEYRIDPKYIN